MKKLSLLIIAYCTTLPVALSQSEPILKSKKGNYILPQEKDWSIGTSASPILTYLGNAFNSSSSNVAPGFSSPSLFTTNAEIIGKYMYRSDMAYFANLLIENNRITAVEKVSDLSINAEPDDLVEDKITEHNYFTSLVLGLEKRRGSTRLQGVYGAGINFLYSSGNYTTYNYGNHIEDFAAQGGPNERIIKEKDFPSFVGIGALGFIGIEYFFAPRMSIGGYYSLNINFNRSLTSEDVYEVWSSSESSSFEDSRLNSSRFTSWQLGDTRSTPNLTLNFYF